MLLPLPLGVVLVVVVILGAGGWTLPEGRVLDSLVALLARR